MADKPVIEAPIPIFTEALPAQLGGISAIASASAPFIYFEGVPNYGFNNGIVNVSLETIRFQSVGDKVLHDRVTVAHLRMNLQAATGLRDSLNAALAMAAPPQNPDEIN